MDIGTLNRPGVRLRPRKIRDKRRDLRPYNMATNAAPFSNMQVADIGEVPINTFDLKKSVDIITAFHADVLSHDTISLTLGGEHTLTWPILRALRNKFGPVALAHVDAHADINDETFGKRWCVDVRLAGLGKTDAGSTTKFVKLICLARDANRTI